MVPTVDDAHSYVCGGAGAPTQVKAAQLETVGGNQPKEAQKRRRDEFINQINWYGITGTGSYCTTVSVKIG